MPNLPYEKIHLEDASLSVKHRILFVVPRFHTNIYNATKALVENGHQVEIFAYTSALLEDHSIVKPKIFEHNNDLDVEKEFDRFKPTFVFLRESADLSTQITTIVQKNGTKIAHYSLRSLDRPRLFYKNYIRWWLKGMTAHRVTPVRGSRRLPIRDPFAHYLPWPVATEYQSHNSSPENGQIKILCVGKLKQRRKNLGSVVTTLYEEVSKGAITVTFAGSSGGSASGIDINCYNQLVDSKKQFSKQISILEDVPFSKMSHLYATHDLCVLPARREPLGMAPLEGMAYGCIPIISNDCGSAGSISSQKDGFVYNVNKPDELREIVIELLQNRKRMKLLKNAAINTAKTELSPETFVKRVEKLLQKLRVSESEG